MTSSTRSQPIQTGTRDLFRSPELFRKHGRAATLALLLSGTLISPAARAEVGQEKIPSGAKGTVGLGLLGAESVLAVEAAFGVKKWWAYAIGGGLGAVGGAVGGYLIDQSDNAELSTGLLVGGLVFAIPTTIAVLSASAYSPQQNPSVDDNLSPAARAEEQAQLSVYRPHSLVGIDEFGDLGLEMPAIQIAPVYSKQARQIYSLPDASSVRVPVFSLMF